MSAPLVATTVAVDDAGDLLAAAEHPGGMVWRGEELALATRGCALRLELPGGLADRQVVRAAGQSLGAIAHDDRVGRPGTGAVALGALPFDPAAPGHLVVPEVLWGRDRHGAWVTTVGPAGTPPVTDALTAASGAALRPNQFALRSSMTHEEWEGVVRDAVERIGTGALDKVVLARRVDVEANQVFSPLDILRRLEALYPSCMVFFVEGFLGASPELLLSRRGTQVESHPLAGTVARSGDEAADDALVAGLLASPKERWEHRLVVDTLAASLEPYCARIDVPASPRVLALRNVSHLATWISGTLSEEAGPPPSVLELVAETHPTPAVGGTPTKAAIAHLESVEGFDRGRYAGPVGWMDARGDGSFALGIRSAVLDGSRASLYAGVGVVGDSDATAELAETQLKLQALLAAVVRP